MVPQLGAEIEDDETDFGESYASENEPEFEEDENFLNSPLNGQSSDPHLKISDGQLRSSKISDGSEVSDEHHHDKAHNHGHPPRQSAL